MDANRRELLLTIGVAETSSAKVEMTSVELVDTTEKDKP